MNAFPPTRRTALGQALRGVLLGLAVAGSSVPVSALAAADDSRQISWNIAAGDLAPALDQFARQAGISLSYDAATVAGKRTPGVRGTLGSSQALAHLLQGTGIEVQQPSANAFVLLPRVASGEALQLGATSVLGEPLGTATDGTGSYTTGAVTLGKTAQSLRETPQSVSVITRQLMDDKNLTTLDRVMDQATGISRSNRNFGSNRFNARGFTLEDDSYMLDGVPGSAYDPTGWLPVDMAVFDRVEILRGAAGLLVGAGNPGGAVNLVRKRPGGQPHFSIATHAGSWDNYRLDLDGSTPLNEAGTVRGRAVVGYEDRGYFQDVTQSKTPLLYGIVESDLNDATTWAVGVRRQTMDTRGYSIFGLPRYTNGNALDVPRSTSLVQDWNRHETEVSEVFSDLEHRLNDDWTGKLSLMRSEGGFDQKVGYVQGAVDPQTGAGPMLASVQFRDYSIQNTAADGHLAGNFSAFGLAHELMLGANWSQQHVDAKTVSTSIRLPIDIFNPNHHLIPEPSRPQWDNISDQTTRQYGLYSTLRLRLAEPLSLVLGTRLSWYKNQVQVNDEAHITTRQDHEFTPFAGLIYDLDDQWSVYASYADIFRPQSDRFTASGSALEPTIGANYETGIKGELYGGRLNLSAALFYIKQKDLASEHLDPADPNQCARYNSDGVCYVNGPPRTSKGVELEASGELLPGWQVMAGYTFNTRKTDDGQTFDAESPKHIARASTTYNFQGDLNRLTLGTGVSAQSGYASDYFGTLVANSGRAVWDANSAWRLDEHWKVGLEVKNILDRKYYEATGEVRRGSYYGAPRSYMVTVRGDF